MFREEFCGIFGFRMGWGVGKAGLCPDPPGAKPLDLNLLKMGIFWLLDVGGAWGRWGDCSLVVLLMDAGWLQGLWLVWWCDRVGGGTASRSALRGVRGRMMSMVCSYECIVGSKGHCDVTGGDLGWEYQAVAVAGGG